MDNNNKEKCYLFCTNNQFTLLDEEKLIIYRFYDISKKKEYSFLWKDNTLYTIIQLNTFGSIFVGNYLMDPNVFIITPIDPLIILLSVMFVATYNLNNNSSRLIKKEDALTNYLEIMEKTNIDESHISQTKDTFLSVINQLFSKVDLSKICDSNYIEYLKEEFFGFNLDKAYKFIDSKLSNCEGGLDRKLDVTKVLSFVNNDFSELYLKHKGIELTIQQEVIMEDRVELKRVNEETKTKNKKKQSEVPKNQKSISSFFSKK